MKNVVVYFHGYDSSAKTDKVKTLATMGYDTFAWNIDINPDVSIPFLLERIDNTLFYYLHQEIKLTFIGTSLGAWYAAYCSSFFGANTILINPCYDPNKLLPGIGVSKEVADLYDHAFIELHPNSVVVIAKDDELLNFTGSSELFKGAKEIIYTETGGHRFNGPEFEEIIRKLIG